MGVEFQTKRSRTRHFLFCLVFAALTGGFAQGMVPPAGLPAVKKPAPAAWSNPQVLEKWWPEGGRLGHGDDGWLELLSMDGLPIYILFKPSLKPEAKQIVLFIPDFRKFPYWQLAQVLPKIREKSHVFVLFPRGHFPSKRFRLKTDIQEKMRDKDFAKNFRWDLRLTNSYIRKKVKTPGRIGVVAGSYFGNLLLWDAAGKAFDYYVFFSPYRTFYEEDTTGSFRELATKKPVVFVGGLGSGKRYQAFLGETGQTKTKLHPLSGVIERKFMGRGYSLIYGWPGQPNPVLDKIDGLMQAK